LLKTKAIQEKCDADAFGGSGNFSVKNGVLLKTKAI